MIATGVATEQGVGKCKSGKGGKKVRVNANKVSARHQSLYGTMLS